jgi:peptide/nickel transport system substrate-binding protein
MQVLAAERGRGRMGMRIRGLVPAVLAVISLALAGAGCGDDSAEPDDTLNVVRAETFDGWVLDAAAAYATYQTHPAVLEGLLRFASDGESVEAGLADEWEYDEKAQTWTFRIRDGATFSDGTPVTSADVAFSLDVWKQGPNFGPLYEVVRQVRTPDKRTAVFELNTPNSVFDSLLSASVSGIMPDDFGGASEDQFYRNPVGAGPYKVDEWSRGGEIVLSPNEHFYDTERPSFNRIVMDVVPDDSERAILFEAGDADIVEYVPAPIASQYGEDSLEELPPSQVIHLSMNTQRPPFDDLELRRAVAHAIDYQSIVEGPLKGFANAPTGILSPNIANWSPPSEDYFTTDLARARDELADSSQPGGVSAELIYDSAVREHELAAQVIQSDLDELGIDVELRGLETGAFVDRAFTLDADTVLWSYGPVSPDISDPLGWILGTSWLFTGFDIGPLGAIYDDYIAADSESERTELVTKFQDQAIRDAPAVAFAETEVIHALADGIEGFDPAPWGLFYYDTLSGS